MGQPYIALDGVENPRSALAVSGNAHYGRIIVVLVAGIVALFSTGIRKVARVVRNIQLTQDKNIFNFMKKRQGSL